MTTLRFHSAGMIQTVHNLLKVPMALWCGLHYWKKTQWNVLEPWPIYSAS